MEYSFFSKDKTSHCKKKVIPWHVQKRYMESFSQLSLNQTVATAFYKKEIKSLKRNNKHLALALQRSRYLAADKENLLIDNGKILDIVNFSRLKLMDMSANIKQATACLDETLLILNSAKKLNNFKANNSSTCSSNSRDYKKEFKNQLQELKIEPIKEVMESAPERSDSPDKNLQPCLHKGKISRVDDCISSPNKKCKLGKKGQKIKKNCKDLPKSSEGLPHTTSTNSKKYNSGLNMESQRKKLSSKSSGSESSSSFKSPSAGLNPSVQNKNKEKDQCKKLKAVKVVLTDIAESYHSPKNNELIHSENSTNFKCLMQNSSQDTFLIKKYIASEIAGKQKSSAPTSSSPQFPAFLDAVEVPNSSENTSSSANSSLKNVPSSGIIPYHLPVLPSDENEDIASVLMKNGKNENEAEQNNEKCTELEKDKKLSKSQNSSVTKKLQFYFDEDYIEDETSSKNKIRKTLIKNKAKKSVLNVKRSIPLKTTSLKSNYILDDNVSKLGKNSFLVTAEIHNPPKTVSIKDLKKKCVTGKNEPCVVLTDIFRSNQGLLSEMVGNGLHENRCFQKNLTNSAEAAIAALSVYDPNSAYMDFENNAENRCIPETKAIIKEKGQRRPSKIVSYKEPPLNVKMRRLF